MRTKSQWKHLLIGLFFVILVFMVTVGIASCKKNTDEDSSSVDEPITGDEAGIYYFDADDAEYLISLKGNNFTLSISDETLYITINEVNKKKATKRGTEDSTNEESVNEEENKKED